MPQVPRYEAQGVVAQSPEIRLSSSRPADSFGPTAAAGALRDGALALNDKAQAIAKEERERAEDTAQTQDDIKLAELGTTLMNPALLTRGEDAFGAGAAVDDGWSKGIGKLSEQPMSEQRKAAFQLNALKRKQQMDAVLTRHVTGESQRHEDNVHSSAINQYILDSDRDGYLNPTASIDSINSVEGVVLKQAKSNGRLGPPEVHYDKWEDKWASSEMAKHKDRIHSGVIAAMLEHEDYEGAEKYLQTNGGHMFSGSRSTLKGSIDNQQKQLEAFAIVEDVLATTTELVETPDGPSYWQQVPGAETREELFRKVREAYKNDPDGLKVAEHRADVRWKEIEATETKELDALQDIILEKVDASGEVPSHLISQLPKDRQRAVLKYARERELNALNAPPDPQVELAMHDLFSLPVTDERSPANLTAGEFWTAYGHELGGQRDKWMTRWEAAVKARSNPKALDDFQMVQEGDQEAFDYFRLSGLGGVKVSDTFEEIKKSPDKAAAYLLYRKNATAALLDATTGEKKPGFKEREEIYGKISADNQYLEKVQFQPKGSVLKYAMTSDARFIGTLNKEEVMSGLIPMPREDLEKLKKIWDANIGLADQRLANMSEEALLEKYRPQIQWAWVQMKRKRPIREILDTLIPKSGD